MQSSAASCIIINQCNANAPVLGAIDAGFDMMAGTVVMWAAVVGGKIWAGRPIVCD